MNKSFAGALVLGAVLALPVASSNYLPDSIASVACAQSKRILVYTDEQIDDQGYPMYYDYELEPDSFGEMEIRGVHCMSFWVTNIGRYFNGFFYDKANWGSDHYLFKFYPDGSYRTRRYSFSKEEAKHKEKINLVTFWTSSLSKDSQANGKNYFDISNWELDEIDHAMAKYIKANYPSLVQKNIAYYADEKRILTQRKADEEQAKEHSAAVAIPNGYQRAFRVASDFYRDGSGADIYIDYSNIQDATRMEGVYKNVRYLVPVILVKHTTGEKKYWKYLFTNVPSNDTPEISVWGSTRISNKSRWYNADWNQISVEEWYEVERNEEGEDIVLNPLLGIRTEDNTKEGLVNTDWSGINFALHADLAILYEAIMYLRGYPITPDIYIKDFSHRIMNDY